MKYFIWFYKNVDKFNLKKAVFLCFKGMRVIKYKTLCVMNTILCVITAKPL